MSAIQIDTSQATDQYAGTRHEGTTNSTSLIMRQFAPVSLYLRGSQLPSHSVVKSPIQLWTAFSSNTTHFDSASDFFAPEVLLVRHLRDDWCLFGETFFVRLL